MNIIQQLRKKFILPVFLLTAVTVVLLVRENSTTRYAIPAGNIITEMRSGHHEISPGEVNAFLRGTSFAYRLIDIRDPNRYHLGAVTNAVNIPVSALLDKAVIKAFQQYKDDSIPVVLYGDTQQEAQGAWMLLRQLGFDNVRLMTGGYSCYLEITRDSTASCPPPEVLKYDFESIMKPVPAGQSPVMERPETLIIRKKKKATVSEGGC